MTVDNHHKLIRIYVPDAEMQTGKIFLLSDSQHHYLRNVMRIEAGDQLRIFNGREGEWLSDVKKVNKKNILVEFVNLLNEQNDVTPIEILASPVKKEAFDLMIEKASELGAVSFQPVICDRTVVHRINEDRMTAIAIEAAEQCERLDIMAILPSGKLKNILRSWDNNKKLIFCIERAKAEPIARALVLHQLKPPLGLLVGPEGGFSPAEIEYLLSLPFVVPVSLGARILRAETALISALACVQAALDQ